MKNKIYQFPKGFFWGTATSAYQVEGGIRSNDWEASKQIPHPGKTCDHYHRFGEDFLLAKRLNQNAHRLSLEWSRIEPAKGQWDSAALQHYQRVLEFLKASGFTTFVTLHHFTNPVWVAEQGGWLAERTVEDFKNYVDKVAQSLGHLIDFWVTVNEPSVYAYMSFWQGIWPPFRKNPVTAWRVYRNLQRAHNQAYRIIHQYYPQSQVGFAQNIALHEAFWRDKLDAWASINYPFNRTKNDYLGLNQYFYHPKIGARKRFGLTDMGWVIHPPALYEVLLKLKKFNLPVYITENGLADARDDKRAAYINQYLAWAQRAISEGVDVRGYFYWSLLDNYEWPVKSADTGFDYKFGLVEVDFSDPALPRKVRPSAYEYGKICQTNSLILTPNS